MAKKDINFDVRQIPENFRGWVVVDLLRELENKLSNIDGTAGDTLELCADSCELKFGTVRYGDGREAMVTFNLIADYKKVTECSFVYDNNTGDVRETSESKEITLSLHDMSQQKEDKRKIGVSEIIRKTNYFLQGGISACVNDVGLKLGTFISKDGREILVSVHLLAEYNI